MLSSLRFRANLARRRLRNRPSPFALDLRLRDTLTSLSSRRPSTRLCPSGARSCPRQVSLKDRGPIPAQSQVLIPVEDTPRREQRVS